MPTNLIQIVLIKDEFCTDQRKLDYKIWNFGREYVKNSEIVN